ncbi:bone morphogenetic protein 10 [Dendroctonus ponderosae]|uniref:TGF-beta family profile domain-containing protein n=1 Tax=Dendroctonus ponderosae TaxID=77166 RepID=U4UD19_DENPD|nr:bone morphogenetic protein 10 [Dendroctonus ponderosae]ERL88491.1 hypothetical protein D910_05877 [Dendroctonus ponderosae]KAH1026145.1 hypothetical protein HUJ05_010707 [Dendroctonus ponderosae]
MQCNMHLGCLLLAPLCLIFCIYIVFAVRSSLEAKPSNEVNIIGREGLGSVNTSDSVEIGALIPKAKHHVPKFMLELYEKNKSAKKREADLVRSLIPAQAENLNQEDVVEELSENHLLVFNIPSSAKDEKFMAAEMKVLTRVEVRSKEESGVKKFLKISLFNHHTQRYSHHSERQIHHLNDTWLTFNLTEEVGQLLQESSEDTLLKVLITLSSVYHQEQNHLKLSILPLMEGFDSDHDYPILILSYSIEEKSHPKQKKKSGLLQARNRRSADIEDYEEETNTIWTGELPRQLLRKIKRNNCRRRPLYVDFAEIKYDSWIVQPAGYDAYQCQGKCFYPVADHLSPTKHAIMQALIHSVDASKASRSCCVPTVLDSISVLYVDERGVLTYRFAYKDMVVVECGCR